MTDTPCPCGCPGPRCLVDFVRADDVIAILDALGLDTVQARPYSLHQIVHREILPAIRAQGVDARTRPAWTAPVDDGYAATSARLDEYGHPPCCTACEGTGSGYDGPCWDCRGTGHPHEPKPNTLGLDSMAYADVECWHDFTD